MGNYTIFQMFENLRRGKQASNFTTNVSKTDLKSSSEQIFSESIRWVTSCQNNWKLISHANISSKGLNKGGLHLNREGYELLQNNFVNFMRSNCSMNVDYPLVSQTLPELVDNDVHSGSLGPSSMPNFYQLNVVSKWPL